MIIYIIIILVILVFFTLNISESFSATRTDIVFSNYLTSSTNDNFASLNEEILVINQVPDLEIKSIYQYIRTPSNSYLIVYARKVDGDSEILLNTVLIKMNKTTSEIIPLLKKSGILDISNQNNIKYYVKSLLNPKDEITQTKLTDAQELYRKYNLCVNSKITPDIKKTTAICKKKYNL